MMWARLQTLFIVSDAIIDAPPSVTALSGNRIHNDVKRCFVGHHLRITAAYKQGSYQQLFL
ncbi:hypothetical protein QFZ34_001292 [Phyllobacterium ifriqiyense]|uniref:Uncharacterized protein n=1 Tax=Phyllobacterium ifriqiyense TaxID=314238 RepID=A0ABU0S840_9HYPH|nr:hypothetical protein [Phyllobacterium ifriqiyense]